MSDEKAMAETLIREIFDAVPRRRVVHYNVPYQSFEHAARDYQRMLTHEHAALGTEVHGVMTKDEMCIAITGNGQSSSVNARLIEFVFLNLDKVRDAVIDQLHDRSWKQAVDDALVSAHIGTTDSFPDASTALNSLLCWTQEVALNPQVSEQAQALIDKTRAACADEIAALKYALEVQKGVNEIAYRPHRILVESRDNEVKRREAAEKERDHLRAMLERVRHAKDLAEAVHIAHHATVGAESTGSEPQSHAEATYWILHCIDIARSGGNESAADEAHKQLTALVMR